MSQISLVAASAQDLEPIALLHAQSWRSTYRGIVPDEFLDRLADSDRREFWAARFASAAVDRWLLLQARGAGSLLGFVSVLLDAEPRWGARLDSLHVSPASKGTGPFFCLRRFNYESWSVHSTRRDPDAASRQFVQTAPL